MRVHVVSDVHGRADSALEHAADGADAFVVLGDLLLFVDYEDSSQGILADVFGAELVAEFVELRTANRHEEAREVTRQLWASLEDGAGGAPAALEAAVRRQYQEVFAAMPAPAYMTYGNVDVPALWAEYVRAGHEIVDGRTVDIGGVRVGLVGGGLPSALRTPFEVPYEEYARKVAAVGEVDVLCCHIPPAVAELRYDTAARRLETGSEAVLEAIRASQPRYALFGHVHQPLRARMRIGRTECVNVGHFRATGTPYVLDL